MKTKHKKVLEYWDKLKEQCIAKPEPYEERKRRREAEIEGFDASVIGTSLNAIACRNLKMERLHVAITSTGGLLHGFSLPGVGATVNGA